MNELARNVQIKPLTAVLVRPKRMSDLPALHRQLNVSPKTQAAFPSTILLNIFNLLGLAEEILTLILTIVAIVVVLYLFVSMYRTTLERKREIATMRALGARRTTVLRIVLLESSVITALPPVSSAATPSPTSAPRSLRPGGSRHGSLRPRHAAARRFRKRRHRGHAGGTPSRDARVPDGGGGEPCAALVIGSSP